MQLDTARTRQYLKAFDFKSLFIDELGWNHCASRIDVAIENKSGSIPPLQFHLAAVAEKHGMVAFNCGPAADGHIPDYDFRRKIEKQAAKSVHEHIIIYSDDARTTQIWQWVKREAGKPVACREHPYHVNQPGESLIQKLQAIAFSLEEEETLTIVKVAGRMKAAFDVERITKRFYDRFKAEHDAFLKFIEGIPVGDLHRWYASVMLNRLMFIYFIQKKAFLDNDENYLSTKLLQSKQRGKDRFYRDFLCPLFFEGFAKKEKDRSAAINKLLGPIPYLNGGLFLKHQIEELHGRHIEISDKAFEKLFEFFDQYHWHLDERPLRKDDEINPDVLGYIFEKYINQKQMGAYYTKEDITEYISKNTVIPFLFDAAKQKCRIAFEGETSVWRLLQNDPDRYIYSAVKKGLVGANGGSPLPLPPEIDAGVKDVSKRTEWNKPAPAEYALPTEIWREVVARRQRYEEVKAKMLAGEITSVNDLITYNLDIRQFAQDVIWNSEGPELLRAFYHAIENVTVLDPTCGSGAFLFAALNILEPLYEACLDRMQVFVDEVDRSEEKHRSDKYSDFRKILKRVSEHPNLKYFIFKSIIVNNLYGVDIMEEAIEICKLRLFLKLVAQIDSSERIEPLPDIDFNIRAGNTLVGFATYDELKQTLQSDLVSLQSLPAIEEKAQDVDRLFKLFHQQQTELGGEVTPEDKQELRTRLRSLEDELNRHHAAEYGVDSAKKMAYKKWLESHKPFHWFIEFYGILKRGGFDVIIGNPPWREYSATKKEYTVRNYDTEQTGNLYALCTERSMRIAATHGYFSFIVQLPLVSSSRMTALRQFLTKHSSYLAIIPCDDRPGKLFDGLQHCRGTIFVVNKRRQEEGLQFQVTRYNRWHTELREALFRKLEFTPVTDERIFQFQFPKMGSPVHVAVFTKILTNSGSRIELFLSNHATEHFIFYQEATQYWTKATVGLPYYAKNGKVAAPAHGRYLFFPSADIAHLVCAALNSSLFYSYFIVYGDCFHLSNTLALSFPLPPSVITDKSLISLNEKLMKDLK
ncbi:MAG: Eco57I restriction-modification methylase domain-containing protein [Nitrospiraceae bacterium]|nr:Eco57I restriction-modification methylase domain-containing protein [Nitrospiraceae bacterium]